MGRQLNRQAPDKVERRLAARDKKQRRGYGAVVPFESKKGTTIVPLNDKQRKLVSLILAKTLTFATGCAGTGKSHIAIAAAVQLLLKGEIEKIVLTKPDFEIDEKLGTLPGDQDEKTAVLFRSMRDLLNKILGGSHLSNLESQKKIVFEPLGSILGLTFENSFVIIDEAQNTTAGQMYALLTRVGKNSKMVVAGDYREQKFIEGRCGLEDALSRLGKSSYVGRVDFIPDDIVRSDFCKEVILAYRNNDPE